MSKVIRIEDELFGRLQSLAEPFIDTPSSVIERLLNFYESSQPQMKIGTKQAIVGQKEVSIAHNLFLAPASLSNIRKTIAGSISLKSIETLLTEKQRQLIAQTSTDIAQLRCWAMTESSRAEFAEMASGDVVVFTIKDSGKFEYRGKVVAKIENEELGRFLWEEESKSNKPWKLIYFLEDVRGINISKPKLVTAVGYKKTYWVPGITRVNRVGRDTILSQYGSIESFIEKLSA